MTSLVKPSKANFNSTFAHEPGAAGPGGKKGEDESQAEKTAESVVARKRDASLRGQAQPKVTDGRAPKTEVPSQFKAMRALIEDSNKGAAPARTPQRIDLAAVTASDSAPTKSQKQHTTMLQMKERVHQLSKALEQSLGITQRQQ